MAQWSHSLELAIALTALGACRGDRPSISKEPAVEARPAELTLQPDSEHRADSVDAPAPALPSNPLSDSLFSAQTVAGVPLCAPLGTVKALFPSARHTIEEDEGQAWPALLVGVRDDEWILFESSWADTSRVWRVTTNSPLLHTSDRLRVGQPIGAVLAPDDPTGAHLRYSEYLDREVWVARGRSGPDFMVRDSAGKIFRRSNDPVPEATAIIDPRAPIARVVVVVRCS